MLGGRLCPARSRQMPRYALVELAPDPVRGFVIGLGPDHQRGPSSEVVAQALDEGPRRAAGRATLCLLYTSDAADE